VVTRVTWHSFDLRSGRRGQEIVAREQGKFGRIIGEATEATVVASCWDEENQSARPSWDAATQAGRVMLVALDENEEPIWGGLVLRRASNASTWVTCTAVTLEHYLDRRYAGDLAFTSTDQATIAEGIIDGIAVDGLDLFVDAPATGILRTETFLDNEDKTALDLLTDLMNTVDGLEFTVDLGWTDDTKTVLKRTIRFRTRIGASRPVPVEFTMPGPVNDFSYLEDYSPSFAANDVLAVSSGEGDARPVSDHQVDQDLIDGGWARYEHRFTPTTSITKKWILNSAAARRLRTMGLGINQLQLTANLDAAPQVNSDFHLGDDLAVSLTCPRFPQYIDSDGAARPGFETTARCVGWTLDLTARVIEPLLRDHDS